MGAGSGRRVCESGCYEARYLSISTVENMAPSNTYHSISDAQLAAHYHEALRQQQPPSSSRPADEDEDGGGGGWDRRYRVVAATSPQTARRCGLLGEHDVFLPFERPGMPAPRLPGLVYR